MAYRMPEDTIVNMLVNLGGLSWRSIVMTQTKTPTGSYHKCGDWGEFIMDDQWHYKCINFNEQRLKNNCKGNSIMYSMIFHSAGPAYAKDTTKHWWMDDFSISDVDWTNPKPVPGHHTEGQLSLSVEQVGR